MGTGAADPAATTPPMIIYAVPVPVAITVQPGTDHKTGTEVDEAIRRIGAALQIHHLWIVLWDIDYFGFRGSIMMVSSSITTCCSGVDSRLPAAWALARKRWMESITSCC